MPPFLFDAILHLLRNETDRYRFAPPIAPKEVFKLKRRTLLGGIALAAISRGALSAETTEAIKVGSVKIGSGEEQIVWTRHPAKRAGRRPSVILLHGTRGFELKPSAYENYANALTTEGIDAYFVHFYTKTDNEKMKAFSTKKDREAYDSERYVAWTERVSSAITAILEGSDSSDRLGLLGFSLGGFVAAATAARDSRVAALAVLYGGMPGQIAPQVKHMPPVIELHGDADHNVPLASGEALVALTKAVGSPAEQVTYPGKGHGFDFIDNDPATSNAVDRVTRFFGVQLGSA